MFEIGKTYKIFMEEGEDAVEYTYCKILGVEGNLIKYKHCGREIILNTASPKFISAEPQA
jgi:hypothetical protein